MATPNFLNRTLFHGDNLPVLRGMNSGSVDLILELDHNRPRSDGGWNHITNRVLLCGPCNRVKSNTYTLSGLRRLNQRNGWMATS